MSHKVYQFALCHTCGKEFALNAYKRFDLRRNPNKRTFCSRRCYSADMAGTGNPKWRGGRTVTGGYAYVYAPDHPCNTRHGYVLEHRLVMEAELGRLLLPTETVHHIDGNTLNNVPENLMLMTEEAEHRRLHARYRTRDHLGRFSGHQDMVTAYL